MSHEVQPEKPAATLAANWGGRHSRPAKAPLSVLLGAFAVVTVLCFALAGYAFYRELDRKAGEAVREALTKAFGPLKK